jgi:TPR repeat protein
MGAVYQSGLGVKRDDQLAFEWFRKAADQNLADATRKPRACVMNWLNSRAKTSPLLTSPHLRVPGQMRLPFTRPAPRC